MKKTLRRFREPSTWTALGAMGGIFGVPALAALGAPEVAGVAASLFALALGVVLPEKPGDE